MSSEEKQMGVMFQATCRVCGSQFRAEDGGGRRFIQIRCDVCGGSKFISHAEIGEPFQKYLQDMATLQWDADPSEEDRIYEEHRPAIAMAIESIAGKCFCGGNFRSGQPLRCPKCRSSEIEKGKILRFYD